MAELTSWGRSMYGGWYANFWYDGEHTGIHADTKTDLFDQLSDYGISPDMESRYDD